MIRSHIIPTIICVLFFSVITQSCDPHEELVFENEISFLIAERHLTVPSEPQLVLEASTKEIFGCINYRIDHNVSFRDDKLYVRVNGVSISNICATAIGPARMLIEIPHSAALNLSKLEIDNGIQVDTYDLSINEESVRINSKNSTFSATDYSTIWRFPKNSFVYKCEATPDKRQFCTEFEDLMINNQSLNEFTFPNEGRTPYNIPIHERNANTIIKFFQYEQDGNFTVIKDLLRDYSLEQLSEIEGVRINIRSWKMDFLSSSTVLFENS